MKIAIIGAGWAGLTAAVEATLAGHTVVVFEASRFVGGRARGINAKLPDGSPVTLDNGQHILIGAYTETLRLMRQVGVDPQAALKRLPLTLKFPDESGLQFPNWPSPQNAVGGILGAKGWRLADKLALLRVAAQWRFSHFNCDAALSVGELCKGLPVAVMQELIEPLCVSALNTPTHRASAQVFLRVMRDSLFGAAGSSDLLLPQLDLTALFPLAATRWLAERGTPVQLGTRVEQIRPVTQNQDQVGWQVEGQVYDAVILANSSSDSARALSHIEFNASHFVAFQIQDWIAKANALQFEAITTVYAWGARAVLARPMLALRASSVNSSQVPAQFVFDRGQLGGPRGLLAFVVSASADERSTLQAQVLVQARNQLGLTLESVQTIVEKRATFACTPALQRPPMQVAPGLLACGDFIDGPYPATIEGAVRSGVAAAGLLGRVLPDAQPPQPVQPPQRFPQATGH